MPRGYTSLKHVDKAALEAMIDATNLHSVVNVANALERRGFIEGDDGQVTPAGEAYLMGLIS